MPDVRSLRDLFDSLVAPQAQAGADDHEPAGVLAAGGHGSLPPDLVAQAVTSYAGTAPLPVAEALSDFTAAWCDGTIDAEDGYRGLDLLVAAAPAPHAEFDEPDPWALDPVGPGLDADLDTDSTGVLDGLWAPPAMPETTDDSPGGDTAAGHQEVADTDHVVFEVEPQEATDHEADFLGAGESFAAADQEVDPDTEDFGLGIGSDPRAGAPERGSDPADDVVDA